MGWKSSQNPTSRRRIVPEDYKMNQSNNQPKKRRRIFWHDAFAWGYKAEFAEEADKLEFIDLPA